MALVSCNSCGNAISDKAVVCPHCGSNVKNSVQQNEGNVKVGWIILDVLIPLIGFIMFFLKKPNQATAKAGLIAALISFGLSVIIQMM